MYQEYLEAVLDYLKGIRAITQEQFRHSTEHPYEPERPYADFVPLLFDGELTGYLYNEDEDLWMYHDVSDEVRKWWDARPGSIGGIRKNLEDPLDRSE